MQNEERTRRRVERRVLGAIDDVAKRAWIEAGCEERQPPEYRGQVWEVADRDGVHPTAFPPLRESAGGELSEEFIDFQRYNQTRYETHPHYYCVRCQIRYNARDGGMCGPCLGETQSETQSPGSPSKSRKSSDDFQYPL